MCALIVSKDCDIGQWEADHSNIEIYNMQEIEGHNKPWLMRAVYVQS